MTVFSFKLLIVALCRGGCYLTIIFQFHIWEIPQMTEYTIFYKNVVSKNIGAEIEWMFSCYLRNPCFSSKCKY